MMFKSKKWFLWFGLFSVISIVLRTILIINNTDISGLYINQSSSLITTLKIVCFIPTFIVLFVAFVVPSNKVPSENRSRNKDKLFGIFFAIFSGAMMFIGLVDFFNIYQSLWSPNFEELKYLIFNTPNSITKILFSVTSFVVGWMSMTLSMKILNKVPVNNNYSLSAVLVLWAVIRSMLFTKTNNTIVTIEDNLYSIIAIIFSISFLFGFSQILFDINCKSGYKMMISSGFVCAFYGLLATVPNYIAFFMGKNLFFSMKDTNGIANFVISVFAITLIYIVLYSEGENTAMFDRKTNAQK